jgi:hypothetical protein
MTIFETFHTCSVHYKKNNLTACPNKSKFAREELKVLGHIVSKKGVKMDGDKVAAIKFYTTPKNLKNLATFLGMVSWYGKYVRDLSQLAAPLNALKKKNAKFHWCTECEKSFKSIKNAICSDTILHFPDYSQPFYVQTDASDLGLGACIYQIINGKIKIISFASRSLNKSEQSYSTTRKEALAAIWACEKWHYYLDLTKFYLVTDHAALQNICLQHLNPKDKTQGGCLDYKLLISSLLYGQVKS